MSGSRQDRPSAAYPFDIEDADVVFTTSDGVEFRVYKAILAVASPFFRDMFSLKKPTVGASEPITVAEDSKIFDALLRLCYPVDDPEFFGLHLLEQIIDAAMKYQLDEATKLLRKMLCGFIASEPLRVFATACRLGIEKEARLAASSLKAMLQLDDDASDFSKTAAGACYLPEMADIPAACYHRLMYYCRTNPVPQDVTFTGWGNPIYMGQKVTVRKVAAMHAQEDASLDSLFDSDLADILLQSSDGVRFRAHTLLFRFNGASKILDEGVTLPDRHGPPRRASVVG